MKFTKGYWLNRPGVTNADAVQVREVKVENDRVYLYTEIHRKNAAKMN